MRSFIDACLAYDAEQRPTAQALKSHPFFAAVDFDNLHTAEPPFVPNPESETDTMYFEGRDRGRLSMIPEL